MDAVKLMRNKWFLMAFSVFFSGVVWGSFQLVYLKELPLYAMYRNDKPPDPAKVMALYKKMIRTKLNSRKIKSFYCLAKVLARVGKEKEEIRVLRKLVRVVPQDGKLRLWLAVELYNQKRYKEAERHFQLLRKQG